MYAVGGGIVVAAVVILLIVNITTPSNTTSSIGQQTENIQDTLSEPEVVDIAIDDINAKQDQENVTTVQIQFQAYNPTRSTVILEAITYNVFTDNERIVSGDIGEKLEGFVASQESVFPIIANGTITLKDSHSIESGDLLQKDLNEILNGQAHYTVNGSYSYKQSSGIDAKAADKDFELTFQ